MRTPFTMSLALLLLGLLASPAGLSAADYRLTGIMSADDGMAFAVIEDADGQQQLIREGGAIGSGYVKSISSRDKTVVLAFPDGELSLRLTGSGKPAQFREEFSIADFGDEVVQQSLDPTVLSKLSALAANPEQLTESQLAAQLNKLLGLSADAQIAAFNNQGVKSTRAILEQLSTQISGLTGQGANYLGSIAVDDEVGRRRVYLSAGPAAD